MPASHSFAAAKADFDLRHRTATHADCIVSVRGKSHDPIAIRDASGARNEEFFKWQFIHALIHSGLYAKDYVGAEVSFPKGNAASHPLRLDAAIFDSVEWLDRYNAYWQYRRSEDLEWLNDHLLAVVEFKKNDKDIEKVFTGQVKPAMKEKDPATAYVLGIYYAAERLYLFHRRDGFFLRYDESLNQKGEFSKAGDLSLHLPDAYRLIPSFDELKNRVHRPSAFDRSRRGIADLDIITSIASVQIKDAFSNVLRAMDQAGLVNQRGYNILVQILALKIFDEKRNERSPQRYLEFYATEAEATFQTLAEPGIQSLIKRLNSLRTEAAVGYKKILRNQDVDWKHANHLRAVVAIIRAFQDYSFVRSTKTDLYQIVFYNFANTFKRDEAAQFLTPLPVIQFLVEFVNPRDGEKVFDPCCGIADFLSLSYVHASTKADRWRLDDANIYGVDLDENMIILATLNMLLNGDGEAKLFERSDKGSILAKVGTGKLPQLRKGDVLFGEAGFQKGRSIVLIDGYEGATTNAHGLYARRTDNDLQASIFFRCIFDWYRRMRLIDLMAVGGSGGHFSPQYFNFLLIPRFPDAVRERVVRLYHSPAAPPVRSATLETFVAWHREWNEALGIWELDHEMKALRATLAAVQEDIIEGRTVRLPFTLQA